MRRWMSLIAIAVMALSCGAPVAESMQEKKGQPLRIFIRAGVKTHGPGEHDHPAFLRDWTELLRSRGAEVDGALEFPTAAQLEKADVLVLFAAEGGTIPPDQRERLDAFLKRGGGIVALHDAVCGKDPQWFKTVVGGAWEHGKSKFFHGNVGIYVQDADHPITKGVANFFMDDEIYWDLHLMPEAKVLATGFRTVHEITPQMWVYEKDAYRAFVNIQGHKHVSFSLPHYRAILLRGIAWAAKRDVDTLVTKEELATLRYPPGGPTAPAQSKARITVEKDFDLSLVLAEPEVIKPISMTWDAKGRLWLVLTPQYPNKASIYKTRPADQVVVFDGKKKTVFYDELDLPTSLALYKDGVIVTQSPEILWLRDTDGDGKADKREVLFKGFGFGDTHAVASNLRWGQDGWLYATQGYSGNASKVTNQEGKDFGKIGNGLFRFKPDGSDIEVVCSYGSNTWGLDFRWDNELFFTMANESHLRHVILSDTVMSKGRIGKTEGWKFIADHRDSNPLLKHTLHPYVQIDCVGGFTAAAGSTIYDGGAWPDDYRNIHFVTECTINLIHQDRILPDGVTFKATKVRSEEFVSGTDLWFRPVDTQIGPDGALYIADFYNQAVVHNDTRGPKHGPYNAAIRPDRDHQHGRVWRLQHKQAKPLAAADLGSVSGLVKALEHDNRFFRLTAQRLLCERGEGASEVAALLKSDKPETRVLALWTLHRLAKLGETELLAALNDAEAGVRKNAARISGNVAKGDLLQSTLAAKLDDVDPRVRLEKIVALGAFPGSPASADALIRLGASLQDPHSRSALVGSLASAPLESMMAALDAGDKALAEELAAALGNKQDGALAAKAVIRIAAKPAEGVLVRLARALKPDVAAPASPELQKALESLLASQDAGIVSATIPFAARWIKDESMAKALEPVTHTLMSALKDVSKADDARVQNLVALLSMPSARTKAIEAATALLVPAASADFQRGVIEALGSLPDPAIAPALLSAYPRLTGASRELILSQILKRPDWTGFLVGEIAEKRIRPSDLGPNALFRLRTHPDSATAKKAAQTLDTVLGSQNKAKNQIIESFFPAVDKQGDLARGKTLLAENCLKCHLYKGEGRGVSPDLTGMGVHGKHELLTHILDPNRTVEGNYVSYNIRTKGGEVFNGIVAREGKDFVTLKNNEGDRDVRRGDIDAMVSTGMSLMPEGLESLGAEALRDILSYLTADAGGYRLIDLQTAFTASSVKGLFDPRREPHNLKLKKFGLHVVEGIPFNVVDPSKSVNGNNAIVLKGGRAEDWHCKTSLPRTVTVQLGFACDKIHVLGGIAAWGTLDPDMKPKPAVRVTYHYADGQTETKVLSDGFEFSDWIKRVDVPGSKFVPGLILDGERGQLRWFTIKPGRREPIHHLTLESYDNHLAPVFLALTADVSGQQKSEAPASSKTLLVGGGSSHDFEKWFRGVDAALLGAAYTSQPAEIAAALPNLQLLVLTNNQPITDPAARRGIFEHVEAGKGLLLVHPACWYNWKDWPEYNRQLVGGGSRAHDKYQEFEVTVVDEAHAITAGVPKTFKVKDELYEFKKDPEGPELQILARGKLANGKEFPVAWVVKHGKGRIACITLGHDGEAHNHPAYQKLLKNAADWATKK